MSERGRDGGEGPEPMGGEDLVSLLYGEMTPDEAARTSARVSSDPALSARLGEMRRVRELFSAMAEEEPPNRLTAQLMAEAARSAPQARRTAESAQAGFWSRLISWLQPMVQRPALAAAASLVLVAGVAGVLYMKKGDELTSTAPATATDSSNGAATAATDELVPEAPPPVATPVPADTAAAADGIEEADGDDANAPAEAAKPTTRAPAPAAKRKRADSYGSSEKKTADRTGSQNKGGREVKSGTVLGLSEQEMVPRDQAPGSEGGVTGGSAGGEAQQRYQPPAQAPAPEPAPTTPAKTDSKPRPPASAAELHKRAIDAALDRRCSDVKVLAGQVRAADSAYYAKNVAGDKRLKDCLSSPSKSAPAKK